MPRIAAILLCLTLACSGCDPHERSRYTSRYPLWHGARIAIAAGLQRLRNICQDQPPETSRFYSWYTPQPAINNGERVQWLGHATTLITTKGFTILTDPVAGDIPAHRRRVPFGTTFENLPEIDIIAISHNHYDHLNKDTLRKLLHQQHREPLVVCPPGVESYIAACGYTRISSTPWWNTISYTRDDASLNLTCVPAHHWSGRTPCDMNSSDWCGWIIHGKKTYYFAGDTAYNSTLFNALHINTPKIDVALLPIAPYAPYSATRTQHMHAHNIPAVIQRIYAKSIIPIHWGTFACGPDALTTPLDQLKDVMKNTEFADRIHPITIGGTYTLAHRSPHDATQHIHDSEHS